MMSCKRELIDSKASALEGVVRLEFLEELLERGCGWSYYLLSEEYEGSDKRQVLFLLRESGRLGDERSLHRLGSYYSFGVGLVRDFVRAYGLYRLAGYMGHKGSDFLAHKISKNMSDLEIEEGDKLFRLWQEDWQIDFRIDRDL